MTTPVLGYVRHVLVRQMLIGLAAYAATTALAPWGLMLDAGILWRLVPVAIVVTIVGLGLALGLSLPRLRADRFTLGAFALGSGAVEADQVASLVRLPASLTTRYVASGAFAAALILVPGLRPRDLDAARASTLALLTFTLVSASAVVHFLMVRAATTRLVEAGPAEAVTSWLEEHALRLWPRRRLALRVLLAAVAPVALVGVGTVLVAHAHVRALVEREQTETAVAVAVAALQPAPGQVPEAGRSEAMAAMAANGLLARVEVGSSAIPAAPQRLASGELVVLAPLDDGRAVVRYTAELDLSLVTTGVGLALGGAVLAAVLALGFGLLFSRDLELASQRVGLLGTERVLRGDARVSGRARFAVVAELGLAIDALAERFRTFAAAQERALAARERAQRMKELLFASVSHDLKSPLNAIVGLAELVREEPLEPAQRESLDLVVSRGRELLALIETILDAARVEADQLRLITQSLAVEALVSAAVGTARDLAAKSAAELVIDLDRDLPHLELDPAYAPQALGVLIAHAMEVGTSHKSSVVHVRARLVSPELARIDIEYVRRDSKPSLLERQLRGAPATEGRGMVLQLSLARAMVELHGGRLEVERGAEGVAVVMVWLPVAPPPAS